MSTIASYVAITRVRNRQSLIIYRPFDRELYSQGEVQGPSLLLKVLRGENIDWDAVQDGMLPRKRCCGCKRRKGKMEFAPVEWRDVADGWCRGCIQEMEDTGTPLRCGRCHVWKGQQEYTRHALKFGRRRFCICCAGAEVRACQKCMRALIQDSFGATWDEEDATRTCVECLLGYRERK